MKEEIKNAWISALRSGDYKQGKTYLRTLDDYYCAMGVLADVARLRWSKTPSGYSILASHSGLHPCTLRELGLTSREQAIVCQMVDNDIPFHEISYWIEDNL